MREAWTAQFPWRILDRFPEVATVVSKTGRAEIAEHPMGPEQSDTFIMLRPSSEWGTGRTKPELVQAIREEFDAILGMSPAFSQPVALRVNELISGIKSDVAVKVFGDDMDNLRKAAERIAPILSGVRGARDIKIEQVSGFSEPAPKGPLFLLWAVRAPKRPVTLAIRFLFSPQRASHAGGSSHGAACHEHGGSSLSRFSWRQEERQCA